MFFKGSSLKKLLDFLPPDSKPVIFNDSGLGGWGQWAAWNPIAEISISLNEDFTALFDFVHKHAGKFMAGYISFEAGGKVQGLKMETDSNSLPAIYFRAYGEMQALSLIFNKGGKQNDLPLFLPHIKRSEYKNNFKRVKNHIRQGDIYQVNYTHTLKAECGLGARAIFNGFSRNNQVAYSAYFEDSDWAIHSFSPERFIQIKDNLIRTEPIKGTQPRGENETMDKNNLKKLLESEKEQAELYMIIDLMRNDLGKISQAGSVHVLESRSIRKLARVMHTYGVVQSRLKPEIQPIEALLALCPGGSISGCPKKRALEIINDLESFKRGIYTGTLGYILPDGTLDFNIAIRTIVQRGEKLSLGVGGGLTVDSIEQDEYNETMAKASSFKP